MNKKDVLRDLNSSKDEPVMYALSRGICKKENLEPFDISVLHLFLPIFFEVQRMLQT